MDIRKKALEALMDFDGPLENLSAGLAAYAWDAESEIAYVSTHHFKEVLKRFLTGSLSRADVEGWANAIEGRDDIGFAPENENTLKEVLHELANPFLTEPLNKKSARKLIRMIETTERNRRFLRKKPRAKPK